MASMGLLTAALWTVGALCMARSLAQTCDLEKQYVHHRRCCNKCPPGTHLKIRCTSTANTTCSLCGHNEYMSFWNEDLKCTRHIVCDPGKALRTSYMGNSTAPRECVCIEGYHFDTRQEICMENNKCHLGFGVQLPVQTNKNTVCIPCPVGYYSNTSSAMEACKRWTNCTDVGLEEIIEGTNISDAICDRRIVLKDMTKVVILIIFPIVASGIVICIIYAVCFRKKFRVLIEQVQSWVQQSCRQEHGSQKKTAFKEQAKNESKDCIHINHSSLEEHKLLTESVAHLGRMIPIEDEYMDQRRSPEPENGSMFAMMGSASDLEIISIGTAPGFSDTSSDRLLPPSQEEGISIPLYSHHHCGQSAKEIQENSARDPVDNVSSHCASQQAFHAFPQAAHSAPERPVGEEPCSCFTERQYSRNGSSVSSSPTTDTPPLSGNVTGNQSTTVISTAPVMNIKTDLVVVYYNSCVQDTHTATETEDTTTWPMQEESQSHHESFVANTQSPRYTDVPFSSVSEADSKSFADESSSPDSVNRFSSEHSNVFFSPNRNVLPVQEEGKPEYYL